MRESGSNLLCTAAIAVGIVLIFAQTACADQVDIPAAKDNTIYEEFPNNSNGAGDHIYSGSTDALFNWDVWRGLIQFDIAGYVPAGSDIDSVRLWLYLSHTDPSFIHPTHRLHRLTADWGESTSDPSDEARGTPAATGDATWNHRFYPSDAWTTPGGDYDPTESAARSIGSEGYYTWSSATMTADVQSWLDSPATDYGWILRGYESQPQFDKRFDSRTNTTPSQRPVLWVYYTPPGPTSPGIAVCDNPGTVHDVQTFDDGQRAITVGDPGGHSPYAHFAWTHAPAIPAIINDLDRSVRYNGYNTALGMCLGNCGTTISGAGYNPFLARGGYASIDVGSNSASFAAPAHVAFNQRDAYAQTDSPPGEFSPFVLDQGLPCMDLWSNDEDSLPESELSDAAWAHLAIDRSGDPNTDVYHVTAHPTGFTPPYDDEVLYWRRVGWESPGNLHQPWEGPVVLDINAGYVSHHVAVDGTAPNVAVIYTQDITAGNPDELVQVVYMVSPVNGANWIADGVPIYPSPLTSLPQHSFTQVTTYSSAVGPEAWRECTGEYDFDGRLHVVWVEQAVAGSGSACRIKHWDDGTGLEHTVVEALAFLNTGDNGVFDLWLASPQFSFGDGNTTCSDNLPDQTNRNYIYLTYEQYGGPTADEGNDVSASGYQNLEFYMTASSDLGQTWMPPVNLTNTKSPLCAAGDCQSERDPSLAKTVDDTLHILYVLDRDAGDAAFGQGSWTFNDVMYYRIPGGADHAWFCPPVTACDCPRQSDFDSDDFLTALDLSSMIDILFAGQPDIQDPDCPSPRADCDCDGYSTALDLGNLIDHLFAGGAGPCDPCAAP